MPAFLEPAWSRLLQDVRDASWYTAHLRADAAAALEQGDVLREVGGRAWGPPAADGCRQIIARAAELARRICSAPLTLDPGDFADENALLGDDGRAYLLDFDNARLAPVVQWFDSVGEDWSSQPAPHLVDVALRAFAGAWNAVGLLPLDWEGFRGAHRSLRVCRKVFELSRHLRDVRGGDGSYDARG